MCRSLEVVTQALGPAPLLPQSRLLLPLLLPYKTSDSFRSGAFSFLLIFKNTTLKKGKEVRGVMGLYSHLFGCFLFRPIRMHLSFVELAFVVSHYKV